MNQKIILTLVAVFALIGISTLVAAFVIVDSPATEFQNDNIDSISNVDSTTSEINSKIIDVDSITIGFIPVEKADELTPKAEVLEKFLESELGIDVKIVVPTNYETIIEGMRFGHIDAAFMDTGPAWITHQRTGAEAVMFSFVPPAKVMAMAHAL